MDPGAELIRLALFGEPVSTSLSPRIHSLFAQQTGQDIDYQAIETPTGGLQSALADFAARGGTGCNITLPLKREAMELAASCSPGVQRCGAANTLVRQAGGGWLADNTDGEGLVRDLLANAGRKLRGADIGIIGAGGATAGILAALLQESPASVTVYNRTTGTAQELARQHKDLGPVQGLGLDTLASGTVHDLLINATSMGHAGLVPDLAPETISTRGSCYDLNYGAAAAPLHGWCEENGIRYRDGLGMLVEQAAVSFSMWTGIRPETAGVLRQVRGMVRLEA